MLPQKVVIDQMADTNPFKQDLRDALHIGYAVGNIVRLTNNKQPVRWYEQVAWTDPANQTRCVVSVDDIFNYKYFDPDRSVYVVVAAVKLLQVFTVHVRARLLPLVFLIASQVKHIEDDDSNILLDSVLDLQLSYWNPKCAQIIPLSSAVSVFDHTCYSPAVQVLGEDWDIHEEVVACSGSRSEWRIGMVCD